MTAKVNLSTGKKQPCVATLNGNKDEDGPMGLFKSKEVVGVDIGTHSIKMVELKESGKTIQL